MQLCRFPGGMEIGGWPAREAPELFSPAPPDAPRDTASGASAASSLGARRLHVAPKEPAPREAKRAATGVHAAAVSRKRVDKGHRGRKRSARPPKPPQADGFGGVSRAKEPRHQFMQRKSKSVPVAGHHMPRRVVKNSALVASISMHEKAFEVRKQAYAAQRKHRQQQEQEAAKILFAEEEVRREARLRELRKQRVQGIVGQFGLDPDILQADELLAKELAAENLVEQRRLDAETRKQQILDEAATAAEMLRVQEAAALAIQRFFRVTKERRRHRMLLVSIAKDREIKQQEEVELVMERVINQVRLSPVFVHLCWLMLTSGPENVCEYSG
eukprot:COSAG05_NODE_59_length_23169_cov_37.393698_15_plen_330_part_00